MKVKIQIDTEAATASVRSKEDHAIVGEVEKLRKKKPVDVVVGPDEYVKVMEGVDPEWPLATPTRR